MKKSKRLQSIVDIKARQEQQALEIFGQSQRWQSELKGQVDHLTGFRRDYVDKCNAWASFGVQVSRLVEFRAFIDKLDVAIAGQEKLLQRANQEVLNKRAEWQTMHWRKKIVEKVRDNALKTEQTIENKKEQRELDERSARFSRNKLIKNAAFK